MKDMNGKTLRRGDVCVDHSPVNRSNSFGSFGNLLLFRKQSIWIDKCAVCVSHSGNLWILPQYLEIIGDVR